MTVAPPARISAVPLLTYEALQFEPMSRDRYDILDGVRVVYNPTPQHQDIEFNIAEVFKAYQRAHQTARMYVAPRDVLIRRSPLRTRQPDVLFISNERLALSPPLDQPDPFPVGPELVVEVISPSETRQGVADKIRDYQSVGVLECWVVRNANLTVEVLRLSPDAVESVAVYDFSQMVASLVFPGLTMPVVNVFAE